MLWLVTEGGTPENTMYAHLLTSGKQDQMTERQPKFVKHCQGCLGLANLVSKGLGPSDRVAQIESLGGFS
jgi:hypothetical protein